MAITVEEFMTKTGAELVGSRLVYGERADRRYVGSIEEGSFNLNDDGKALLAALEAGTDLDKVEPAKKRGRQAANKDGE
jgi:hypothetical protein